MLVLHCWCGAALLVVLHCICTLQWPMSSLGLKTTTLQEWKLWNSTRVNKNQSFKKSVHTHVVWREDVMGRCGWFMCVRMQARIFPIIIKDKSTDRGGVWARAWTDTLVILQTKILSHYLSAKSCCPLSRCFAAHYRALMRKTLCWNVEQKPIIYTMQY